MKTLKHLSLLVILIQFIVLCGCTFTSSYENRAQDKKDAETITDNFFDDVKKNDSTSLYKLFSQKFWEAASKDKLNTILTGSRNKLGDIITTDLQNWETKVVTGTVQSGDYKLLYKVHRQKYDSKEEFELTKDDDGKIRIAAFNINSEGFFK